MYMYMYLHSAAAAPPKLLCPINKCLLKRAVVLPCCRQTVNEDSIVDDSEFTAFFTCPLCSEADVYVEKLSANDQLRAEAVQFERGYVKDKDGSDSGGGGGGGGGDVSNSANNNTATAAATTNAASSIKPPPPPPPPKGLGPSSSMSSNTLLNNMNMGGMNMNMNMGGIGGMNMNMGGIGGMNMNMMQTMMGNIMNGLQHGSSSIGGAGMGMGMGAGVGTGNNPWAAMMAQCMPYQKPSDIPIGQLANPVYEEEFNKAKQGKLLCFVVVFVVGLVVIVCVLWLFLL